MTRKLQHTFHVLEREDLESIRLPMRTVSLTHGASMSIGIHTPSSIALSSALDVVV
jgi:hypothetical protein